MSSENDYRSNLLPGCCEYCLKSDVCKYKTGVKDKVKKIYEVVNDADNKLLPLHINPTCKSFSATEPKINIR